MRVPSGIWRCTSASLATSNCSAPSRESLPPPHDCIQARQRSVDLDPLKRKGRVDVLRADDGALPHESAVEGSRSSGQEVEPFGCTLVPRVEVVPIPESGRRRSDELLVRGEDRTRRITEHAVDAGTELVILLKLLGLLRVLSLLECSLPLPDYPRLNPPELLHEVADVNDEVLLNWKVVKRLDNDLLPRLWDWSRACQPRGAVNQRPATPADSPPTRPSEGERPVKPVTRVVECIQDEHLRMVLYFVLLVEALGCLSREVPLDPYPDLLRKGTVSTFFQYAATSSRSPLASPPSVPGVCGMRVGA